MTLNADTSTFSGYIYIKYKLANNSMTKFKKMGKNKTAFKKQKTLN